MRLRSVRRVPTPALSPVRILLLVLLCILPLLGQSPRIARSATDVVFTNDTDIFMYVGRADYRRASPYPSAIAVSGVTGKVGRVQVQLFGLTHYRPDDLDIALIGPTGGCVKLMSDAGGEDDVTALDLTFTNTGGALPDSTTLGNGPYRATNFGASDTFDAPVPSYPCPANLGNFTGTLPSGTWSLYVMDDIGWTSPGSISGWSLTLSLDTTAPVSNLTSTPAPNANGWHKGTVELLLEAVDDPGGAGVHFLYYRIIRNGEEVIVDDYRNTNRVVLPSLTSDGVYEVSYHAVDLAGNRETERTATFRIDTRAPDIFELFFSLGTGTLLPTGIPVAVDLYDFYDEGSTASDIEKVRIQRRTNNGPWETIPGGSARLTLWLLPGNTYQFRAWVVDYAGNRSINAVSERNRLVLHQESSAAIVDVGVWTTGNAAYASGGRLQYATAAGREVLFTFSGTDVAWVTTRGPNQGIAELSFDSASYSGYDLYQTTRAGAQALVRREGTNGIHTVRVRVTGTANPASSGSQVDVDAFVVLSPVP